ncbi:DMT family transporter [Sphingomonas canadensis]|uniref:DMT family transporter n=1 Tax=Sphingomonas canadensis TaxID=1219257 RepID=A0ABW3H2D6_9SPHN|nr:DMT family transporter [Sphingomonas canadensis]MCW3834776.1 DMT family transporter [Sphingomonas canadensis]
MHDSQASRKTAPGQTATGWHLAALLAGNIALAFGPWFVRGADVGPVAAGFWRVAIAAPLLIGLCYAAAGPRPFAGARGHWWALGLAGFAFAGDLASWHLGLMKTTLANSTLFGNSATLMFPIYGFLAARAWPTRQQGLAFALAAAGAVLLLGRSYSMSPEHLAGDLLCLLAGALYTVYFVLMLRARRDLTPFPALALSTIATVPPMLIFALALGETVWPHNWGILIGLALASQVLGQSLVLFALRHIAPLVVGIALLVQPIVAGAVGWIVYGERLGLPDLVGAMLIAAALVLVRRAE